MAKTEQIDKFNFDSGRRLGGRYVVEHLLGSGTEGEVYQVREHDTGIRRAAKLYYPHRNPRYRTSIRHAQKLNALRHCPIVLQYHHSEQVRVKRQTVICLISDLCEGEPLYHFVSKHPGRRVTPYRALHVLYNLVRGLEAIHALGEYHADVHSENIMIKPVGVKFDLKLIDFYDWGRPSKRKQQQDILDSIGVFHEILGGRTVYRTLPDEIRHICGGMKHSLIHKRFPTITALRMHLETFEWSGTL